MLTNYATLGGHVMLGDWVIMAGYSGIHQFTRVGAHAFLGNNAAVTRDVPPYIMAVGSPAVPHSITSEGLKRRGFTPEQIRNLRTRTGCCTGRISGSQTPSLNSSHVPRHNPS